MQIMIAHGIILVLILAVSEKNHSDFSFKNYYIFKLSLS